MKAEAPQQEEVPISQNSEPPLENQQEEGQPMSPRKKKPKWAEQLLKEASEQVKSPKTSVRTSIPPQRYSGYAALMSDIVESEPTCFEEANARQVWEDSMMEEYASIIKNDVWEIVPRPKNKSVVSSKWIYKIKHVVDGNIENYKARFVARGFSQKEGVDYDETFAPVACYTSIRAVMSIATQMGWRIHQMDVKTTFLNGKIEEEVYLEQPLGFEVHTRASHVCRLKKALYGLKQAPRAWYSRIDNYLQSIGFVKSDADSNLYLLMNKEGILILVLYVDDLFLIGA
jgi:hypothetical protein